jgi:hypothetical protein
MEKTRRPPKDELALVEAALRRVPGSSDPWNQPILTVVMDEFDSVIGYFTNPQDPEHWDNRPVGSRRKGRPRAWIGRAATEICYIYVGRVTRRLPTVVTNRKTSSSAGIVQRRRSGDFYVLVHDVFDALRLKDPGNHSKELIAERRMLRTRWDFSIDNFMTATQETLDYLEGMNI